jgi:hypothetical protein
MISAGEVFTISPVPAQIQSTIQEAMAKPMTSTKIHPLAAQHDSIIPDNRMWTAILTLTFQA